MSEEIDLDQEQYITEHAYADNASEAHPIDSDVLHEVCDTKMGPVLLEYDLALIQAVAVREVLPYHCDHETWIERAGDLHYYQVQSRTFYDLITMAHQRYDTQYIEIEDAPDIVEAHTRQYLKDVHGYEGDFGGQVSNDGIDAEYDPTLCSAQNDAHWLRDEEPESAHYAFMDARGLVIEEGTHPE